MVAWVAFNAKRLLLAIEEMVAWVVSFMDSEIKVFALNLCKLVVQVVDCRLYAWIF